MRHSMDLTWVSRGAWSAPRMPGCQGRFAIAGSPHRYDGTWAVATQPIADSRLCRPAAGGPVARLDSRPPDARASLAMPGVLGAISPRPGVALIRTLLPRPHQRLRGPLKQPAAMPSHIYTQEKSRHRLDTSRQFPSPRGVREIRTLRLTRRGLETWQGRDAVTLADERASNGEHKHRPTPARQSSTLPTCHCDPSIGPRRLGTARGKKPAYRSVAASGRPARKSSALSRASGSDTPDSTSARRSSSATCRGEGSGTAVSSTGGSTLAELASLLAKSRPAWIASSAGTPISKSARSRSRATSVAVGSGPPGESSGNAVSGFNARVLPSRKSAAAARASSGWNWRSSRARSRSRAAAEAAASRELARSPACPEARGSLPPSLPTASDAGSRHAGEAALAQSRPASSAGGTLAGVCPAPGGAIRLGPAACAHL